nr:MAG TPA: hypothetical protein [Caudoviricetes sp.]
MPVDLTYPLNSFRGIEIINLYNLIEGRKQGFPF